MLQAARGPDSRLTWLTSTTHLPSPSGPQPGRCLLQARRLFEGTCCTTVADSLNVAPSRFSVQRVSGTNLELQVLMLDPITFTPLKNTLQLPSLALPGLILIKCVWTADPTDSSFP